jgi:Domain of unknown function (DUF4062)
VCKIEGDHKWCNSREFIEGSACVRVYVASTYFELGHFREAAEHVIRTLGHEPEMLNALDGLSDEAVVAELRRRVGLCDCVVVVVGLGRGSTPKMTELEDSSFTAVEYETASRHQLPILVFHVRGKTKSIRGDLPFDIQAAIRSENVWVERFKETQLNTHVIKVLEHVEEFQAALAAALIQLESVRKDSAG